jgi:hypothetical protein
MERDKPSELEFKKLNEDSAVPNLGDFVFYRNGRNVIGGFVVKTKGEKVRLSHESPNNDTRHYASQSTWPQIRKGDRWYDPIDLGFDEYVIISAGNLQRA